MAPTMTRRELMTMLAAAALPMRLQTGRPFDTAQGRPIIRTILRDVSPDEIDGPILFHEHLSMRSPWTDDLELMAQEVAACKASGVRCIVDNGTIDLGRKIASLRTIAERSNMLIVASGGLHAGEDYPPEFAHKSADEMADAMFRLATTERWGSIGEMGTKNAVPIDREERNGLLAAAKLHQRTGLPIITHVSDGCARCALDQVDLFESAGVPLDRVVIGHLNDIKDQPTVAPMTIAKRGAYVGFDHSGKPDDPRADEYVKTLLTLIEAGHANRICLSSDFSNAKYLRKNGGPGIDMTITNFVPRLKRAGVDDRTLRTILVENPRRVLTFNPRP